MRYYIIVGEASGDVHGSKLMEGLKLGDPNAEFRFWGGDRMAAVGGRENMVYHYRDNAFMGFVEVLKHLGTINRRLEECKNDIKIFNPDVVILIDYAGFNLRIAKFAKKAGIKTFYYIAPKVWAWNASRVKKIRRYVDELFVILSFEVDYFKKRGVNAHYLGNPIIDEVKQRVANADVEGYKHKYGLDKPFKGPYTIALLAGSRQQEIDYNLPFMISLANTMPDSRFILAGVSWLDNSLYEKYLTKSIGNILRVTDFTFETLLVADAAVVTSGTATLETALVGTPEVVVYRCAPLTFALGRRVVRVKYLSLANLIFDRACLDEYLQENMTIKKVKNGLENILNKGERREQLLSDYAKLKTIIGESGSSYRVATEMIKILNKN
ncbi:MAG: lipid-A-disaccharide synthase [Rikenellaceae bacterium]